MLKILCKKSYVLMYCGLLCKKILFLSYILNYFVKIYYVKRSREIMIEEDGGLPKSGTLPKSHI